MLLPSPVVLISPSLALLRDQHEKPHQVQHPVRAHRRHGARPGARGSDGAYREGRLAPRHDDARDARLRGDAPRPHEVRDLARRDRRGALHLGRGFDFRPAYLRLGETLRKLGRPPLLALTATATEKVRTDIVRFPRHAHADHRRELAAPLEPRLRGARVPGYGGRLRALARLAQRLRRRASSTARPRATSTPSTPS